MASLDGYVLVQKALALAATHRRHAAAAANPGSLLARNLALYAAE